MLKFLKTKLVVVSLCCLYFQHTQAVTLGVERWGMEREVEAADGSTISYNAVSNALSLTHRIRRTDDQSFQYRGRLFQESSDEPEDRGEFNAMGVAIEASWQSSKPSGSLVEGTLGLSYRKYDVFDFGEVAYFGISLGGAFAVPVYSNKVFIGGTANYQSLKDTDNGQANEGYKLSGVHADIGIIYAYQKLSFRVGYRIRDFKTSAITNVSFDDEARGVFAAVSLSF